MRQTLPLSASLVLLSVVAIVFSTPNSEAQTESNVVGPYRCSDASLYFPATGIVGWKYRDPDGTDIDAYGNRTLHTGVDIFGAGGDGSAIYAPADGVVSRHPGGANANIVLPGVTNVLTGTAGIELYLTHIRHSLVANQTFKAGEVIAVQEGQHLHFSVGAFTGYDDREVGQTQDPSPYFNAQLSHPSQSQERVPVERECRSVAAGALVSARLPVITNLRVVDQDCRSNGVRVRLAWNSFRAGDWVDLSLFNNGFTSDFLALRASSSPVMWEGLLPGVTHYIRINRSVGPSWVSSQTLEFVTRSCR